MFNDKKKKTAREKPNFKNPDKFKNTIIGSMGLNSTCFKTNQLKKKKIVPEFKK